MTSTDQASYRPGIYRGDVTAELVPDLDHIGAAEIERYRTEGFLGVEKVFDDIRVGDALDGLTTLLMEPRGAGIAFETWAEDKLHEFDGPPRLDLVRKFMRFVDYDQRLHALAYDERLLSVVRRIIGTADITLLQDMALIKPPGGGREKPWHQDNAFFRIKPGTPIVGVWIALDEATIDNGCMHVLPGTHREGPVIHFNRLDWQICETDVQTSRDVAVPLPPGGGLFFDGLIHHGTPPNNTDARRRALQYHYIDRATIMTTPEERMETFGSEGKDVEC
jgi:phytanoyl-CoA hydroxylase